MNEEQLEGLIRRIAREEIVAALGDQESAPTETDQADVPPEPQTLRGLSHGGRRENRMYGRVSATIDIELLKRFEAERERLKCSTGRLLDIILWRHYGRPKLSFELEGAEERAKKRPRRPHKKVKN